MAQTIYVIPGYGEQVSYKRYRKSMEFFHKKGFEVISVKIKWKNHTMTDYVNQFLKSEPKEGSYLFGFSFGAMIAFMAAKKTNPKAIILCSLSPYFKEDIYRMSAIYGDLADKILTEKQICDLKKHSFSKIVKTVKCKTILLAGNKETVVKGKNYPVVLDRAKKAKRAIRDSRLIIVRNGRHDISQSEYHAAIKKVFFKL